MSHFFVLRHAESTSNNGEIDCKDPLLSKNGINQCKQINGFYDLIIMSPLRRTQETLKYSNITYKNMIITDLCRERIFHIRDLKIKENDSEKNESDLEYNNRVNEFKNFLLSIKKDNIYEKILIVSHSYFCTSLGIWGLKNAEIREFNL